MQPHSVGDEWIHQPFREVPRSDRGSAPGSSCRPGSASACRCAIRPVCGGRHGEGRQTCSPPQRRRSTRTGIGSCGSRRHTSSTAQWDIFLFLIVFVSFAGAQLGWAIVVGSGFFVAILVFELGRAIIIGHGDGATGVPDIPGGAGAHGGRSQYW